MKELRDNWEIALDALESENYDGFNRFFDSLKVLDLSLVLRCCVARNQVNAVKYVFEKLENTKLIDSLFWKTKRYCYFYNNNKIDEFLENWKSS